MRHAAVWVALVALSMAACGTPPPRYPVRDARLFVTLFRAREQGLGALHARGSAEHYGRQGRIRGSVDLYVRLPDHIRVDTFAFGNLVSSLVSDGTRFTLLQGTQLLEGPARACVAAQLLGIPMEVREVAVILSGGAPLLSDRVGPPRWEDGRYVFDVAGMQGTSERIELELPSDQRALPIEQQRPRLRRVVLRDAHGVRAEITYQGYRTVRDLAFPDRVRIVMPRDGADTQIRFDEITPGFTVAPDPDDPTAPSPDPFAPPRPTGVSVERIDC